MKIEKKYATLIVVIIILIFLFGFSYFSKFSFKLPITSETKTPAEQLPLEEIPQHKTLTFASASCSISGNTDIVKFKIQSTGINIGLGELAAFLDDSGASFKNLQGISIDSISLVAGTTSDEFSYIATDHKASREITVSSPAGTIDKTVTCS